MKPHHLCAILLLLLFAVPAFAIESRSQREAVISTRAKRFYKSSRARQYLSLGGNYASDYNSRSYQLNSRYLYQDNDFIHEFNFEHQTDYKDKSKQYDVKTSDLYNLSLASKARIHDSQNYGVIYHRTIHDNFAVYPNDMRTALGIGHIFLRERLEWDVSMSYHDVQNYGSEVDFITSWRANFKLSDNLTFIQRAYWFFDHNSVDNDFRSSLVYRIGEKLSFEIRHNFEQRRYTEDGKTTGKNLVSRSITLGLVFFLN
ncbi:MAG: DUF481 domain-containing protein [Alphaproteobacteria bacterium]|nr:DUF481 domain-containing protein [Alphaproteobacteria bacterium]